MHIHGNQANLNTINPYSAAAEQAQAAARRAANTRKRLMKNAAAFDGVQGMDEERLMGKWENSDQVNAREGHNNLGAELEEDAQAG